MNIKGYIRTTFRSLVNIDAAIICAFGSLPGKKTPTQSGPRLALPDPALATITRPPLDATSFP
jgi:hypothetical protein